MSVTVGEVKESAQRNLRTGGGMGQMGIDMAKEQLNNYNKAIELGAKDTDPWDNWKSQVFTKDK